MYGREVELTFVGLCLQIGPLIPDTLLNAVKESGMSRNQLLFSDYDLEPELQKQKQDMLQEIHAMGEHQLLHTSIEELAGYFESKYCYVVPVLLEDRISVARREVGQTEDKATEITYFIPFEGDSFLFRCQPSRTWDAEACISNTELRFVLVEWQHDAAEVKREFNRNLDSVRQNLTSIGDNVRPFNESLRGIALGRLESRRDKLMQDQELVAGLGFPLRRRTDAPQTYVVPVARKKIAVRMPEPSVAPCTPEPTLAMEDYDQILSIIGNMSDVMERSPSAFREMGEEDLRWLFLIPLNAQYEGQATGETFNFEGKTDILVRENGKNVFTAECKIWDGPAAFTNAINQLLGYVCWRDTKTAILLFNRNKDFSAVLAQIPEAVKNHPNLKRELAYESETGFRFVLHHRDDKDRELILTVLAFEVPS